jgi:RNA polymerase sigma factor (sigma-70 family)
MLTDAVLVERVTAGFDDAFDELYRRHANAAWRLAQAVTNNSHDAADAVSEAFARVLQAVRAGRLDDGGAFRSYLLTATRNASLDTIRRRSTTKPTDNDDMDVVDVRATPAEKIAGNEDAVLVAEAFRNLPERWRSVLWLTEVEGVATKDAADQLGLTPNGTAQLAVRARAGLRERYLQAHVRNHAKPECKFTVDHLGAYVAGAISPRDLAKVDQHLAACEDCRARKEELEDLGTTLRRIVFPLPLALGALSATKVHAALAASHSAGGGAGAMAKVIHLAKEPTPMMRRIVGASAAGIFTLGMFSAALHLPNNDSNDSNFAHPKRAATAETPNELPEAILSTSFGGGTSQVTPFAAAAAAPPAYAPYNSPPSGPVATPSGGDDTVSNEPSVADSKPTSPKDPGTGSSGTVGAGVNLGPDDTVGATITIGTEPEATLTHNGDPVVSTSDSPSTTPTPDSTAEVVVNGQPVFSL